VILLDTCVISEVARQDPDVSVARWFTSVPDDLLRLSVLSLGEIRKGVDLLGLGARRTRVEAWLEGLLVTFADRILPVDQQIALHWGTVSARCQRAGRPRPPIDALLAATAIRHRLTLATRNLADFADTGVDLLDPWNFER